NVNFDSWMAVALNDLRSSREAWLCVGTGREGGAAGLPVERRAEVPDTWLRGLLRLQEAMALPGTRITARPVDVLAAVRFLEQHPTRVSPRALRYEFEPGQPVRLVLEPWEQGFTLKGTEHHYDER